jgi:hypothetical protein
MPGFLVDARMASRRNYILARERADGRFDDCCVEAFIEKWFFPALALADDYRRSKL